MHHQLETFIYIRTSENSLLVGSSSDSPCASSSTLSSSSSLSLLSLLSLPSSFSSSSLSFSSSSLSCSCLACLWQSWGDIGAVATHLQEVLGPELGSEAASVHGWWSIQ